MARITRFAVDIKKLDAFQKRLRKLQAPIDQKTAKRLGGQVVREMKNLIKKGVSPIRGPGIKTRFQAYKNPKRYPGKRKNKRPVNLRLSGDFLHALEARLIEVKNNWVTVVGYFDNDQADKEQGHREGANKQRKRPTIPNRRRKETFAARINKIILKLYGDRVRELTRKKL